MRTLTNGCTLRHQCTCDVCAHLHGYHAGQPCTMESHLSVFSAKTVKISWADRYGERNS